MRTLELAAFLNQRLLEDRDFAHLEVYVMRDGQKLEVDHVKSISTSFTETSGLFVVPKEKP